MHCTECGKSASSSSKFCAHCGCQIKLNKESENILQNEKTLVTADLVSGRHRVKQGEFYLTQKSILIGTPRPGRSSLWNVMRGRVNYKEDCVTIPLKDVVLAEYKNILLAGYLNLHLTNEGTKRFHDLLLIGKEKSELAKGIILIFANLRMNKNIIHLNLRNIKNIALNENITHLKDLALKINELLAHK